MKMKKEESSREEAIVNKTDSTSHGGNKVLPINHEASLSSSAERKDHQCDKKKPISRMKELLRWAASAKTEKGAKFYGKKKKTKGPGSATDSLAQKIKKLKSLNFVSYGCGFTTD
ncbi:hypothetical protein L195_g032621 [Trifolium pratense]|uniref:Uncharacterized protein n=1 Tax=Trifolium pratense TaxID=57577 RepID=A0A2K3LDP1_TRIPR|nr:hypothetical protein L195_g032621 [Trifolium pratense]